MSERLVFIDALQELGFENHNSAFNPTSGLDWIGERIFVGRYRANRKSSAIVVSVWRGAVEIVWEFHVHPGDEHGVAVHTFLFPQEWAEAIAHVKHLIELAEHKARTGETLPIVREIR